MGSRRQGDGFQVRVSICFEECQPGGDWSELGQVSAMSGIEGFEGAKQEGTVTPHEMHFPIGELSHLGAVTDIELFEIGPLFR